mmetsp:Transcript_17713/g.23191  ORF Transcript_17713/g.23191 Transcript_17713/m.23191 type:complete len:189 (-) Transcript_17713:300-866(-)
MASKVVTFAICFVLYLNTVYGSLGTLKQAMRVDSTTHSPVFQRSLKEVVSPDCPYLSKAYGITVQNANGGYTTVLFFPGAYGLENGYYCSLVNEQTGEEFRFNNCTCGTARFCENYGRIDLIVGGSELLYTVRKCNVYPYVIASGVVFPLLLCAIICCCCIRYNKRTEIIVKKETVKQGEVPVAHIIT